MAPAGDFAALEAALEAGAGAVYFGLTSLNARRRAKNFRQEEFVHAVETVHARGARAYLTLNIDVTERELGQAARIMELARQCRVDAVLVRDPALLALAAAYPELPLHFSTQTCMANSADVSAARELGASRVVLARELTLAEIAAASAVPGIETEVFVQGALCFSVSGRCLLSSWVGGRSGNRGACTSPCRVPWSADEQPAGTPLSMRDLSLIHRLDDLRKVGVSALKIEGRLKNAVWVREAVGLYRRALEGDEPLGLLEEAAKLGAYTGRALTWGYLDGDRDELTGVAGRPSLPLPLGESRGEGMSGHPKTSEVSKTSEVCEVAEEHAEEEAGPTYEFSMNVGPKAIDCRVCCGGQTTEWSIPKTVVRRKYKAAAIGQLLAWLETQAIQGCRPAQTSTNDPEFLLVPRAVNALVDRISAAIRLAQKAPHARVRIDLPEQVARMLTKRSTAAANRLRLGDAPDRVRLEAGQVQEFLKQVRPGGLIVDGPTPQGLEKILAAAGEVEVVAALPQVFFEDEIPAIEAVIWLCARAGATVEVNSWGGWWLARRAGVRMESGPGLPVLNALAARRLREAGIRCVTLSIEAQRRQLEELSAVCPVPCSVVVFGRPALVTTRAQLPRSRFLGKVLADRRGVRLVPRVERGLWVFRPAEPFDLRASGNERIRAQHLVVDLVGSNDPVGEWLDVPLDDKRTFRFNYDRSLA
jgi:putative protease